MGLRPGLVGVAAAVALALTGCAASGDDAAGAAPAATTTAADSAGGTATASAPVSAEALCAHLKKESPRIKAVGSEVGAEAQLAMSIASLYGDHLDQLDGSVVDAQAAQTCPGIRAELLKATGRKSFADL